MSEATTVDVIVAGGGPAGIHTAIECVNHDASVVVVERFTLGGELINIAGLTGVPGQAGVAGAEYASILTDALLERPVQLELEEITGIERNGSGWVLSVGDRAYHGNALVACLGARPANLPARGEAETDPFRGSGISTCAPCDAPLYRNKMVAVAGGGDTGVEAALALNAASAHVVLFERSSHLTAQAVLVRALSSASGVEVRCNTEVVDVAGDGHVSEVLVQSRSSAATIAVDGVALAVGLRPNSELLKGVVDLDERGAVLVDASLVSSSPNLFAAGDVRSGSSFRCVAALGDATVAAAAALSIT